MTTKVPLVIWSGGLDSTAVLLYALRLYRKVDVVSIEWVGQDYSVKRMETATARLKEVFKSPTFIKRAGIIGTIRNCNTVMMPGYHCGDIGLGQVIPILSVAVQSCNIDTDHVLIGYIAGDSSTNSLTTMTEVWPKLLEAAEYIGFDHGNNPRLIAPFKHSNKAGIINYLPNALAKDTTWCESLTNKNNDCGVCPSCKRMIADFTGLLATTDRDLKKEHSSLYKRVEAMKVRLDKERKSKNVGHK